MPRTLTKGRHGMWRIRLSHWPRGFWGVPLRFWEDVEKICPDAIHPYEWPLWNEVLDG